MNMKQKMIEAMDGSLIYTTDKDDGKCGWEIALDAALAVAADPANWDEGMTDAAVQAHPMYIHEFAAVINHIKGLPT